MRWYQEGRCWYATDTWVKTVVRRSGHGSIWLWCKSSKSLCNYQGSQYGIEKRKSKSHCCGRKSQPHFLWRMCRNQVISCWKDARRWSDWRYFEIHGMVITERRGVYNCVISTGREKRDSIPKEVFEVKRKRRSMSVSLQPKRAGNKTTNSDYYIRNKDSHCEDTYFAVFLGKESVWDWRNGYFEMAEWNATKERWEWTRLLKYLFENCKHAVVSNLQSCSKILWLGGESM